MLSVIWEVKMEIPDKIYSTNRFKIAVDIFVGWHAEYSKISFLGR
jgi:hypothetical protein